ncbi:MAG: hypothetical protein HFH72_08645 [Lachnospiraceae bacterium]|nr:hypothetical protein [Lachnospiraceae bacterium]
MVGYSGYSMSNNAVSAYNSGEMPLSKWTKVAILAAIFENCEISEEKAELLRKMTAKELKDDFLQMSSWHHTSKFYNCTNFYSLDFDKIKEISTEKIENIISNRQKKARRSAEEIQAEKGAKAARKAEKKAKEEKERLFKYQNRYKTLSGFMRSNSVNLDELRKIRIEKIAEKREQLRKTWEKQNCEWALNAIDDDAFIETYIR